MLIWPTCVSNETSDVDSTFAGVSLVGTTDIQNYAYTEKKIKANKF